MKEPEKTTLEKAEDLSPVALKQMYDLAAERPETACKRLHYAAHPLTVFAYAQQIEAAHGLFSDELWDAIKKVETIPAKERHSYQEGLSKLVLTFIQENNHA